MKPSRLILFLLALLPFAAGCELLGDEGATRVVTTGVLVANQGNFSQGNGSVSAYDPETGQVNAAAVSGLGAIVQSLYLFDGRLYVVANTGDRIDVFDADTFERVGQIDSLVSPRYLVVGEGRKAYVTNQYGAPGTFTGGKVSVVDLTTNRKLKDIPVGDNPEGVTALNGKVYVANHGFGAGRTVSVIDMRTDAVVATYDADCDGPRFAFPDGLQLTVVCTGQTLYGPNYEVVGETNGGFRVLDAETGAIVKRIDLDGRIGTAGPGQDAEYDFNSRVVYAVKDGHTILRFDTDRDEVTATIGPLDGAPIGAVAADPFGERLYVGHVPGFTERGTVTIHDLAGAQVGSFAAGIVPSHIVFRGELH